MEIKINNDDDFSTINVFGEIDLNNSNELRIKLNDELNSGKSLKLNLSEVTYIDSSGVSCLVEATQISKKNNIEFSIIDLSESVKKVLELAYLDKILPIK